MFRTLIVPLDGSEEAERALPYAVRLALASGGRLALIRTVLGPLPSSVDWERQQLAAVEEAEAYLTEVTAKLTIRVPVTTAAPFGHTLDKLLEAASAIEADAIVMATHGRTGLDHFVHGSVAESILARSPIPVLVVHARPGELPAAPFDPASARALVSLDGSSYSEAALAVALQLVGTTGELILVAVAASPDHVECDEGGRPRAYLDQQEESLKREALDYLRQLAARLKQTHPDLRTTMDVRVGDPGRGIAMAELDRMADVVVMSTHGRTGLLRGTVGSVAGDVLRIGPAPVFLVGPGWHSGTVNC